MYIEKCREKKILAYFACGPINRIPIIDYDPFDIVILVDRHLGIQGLEGFHRTFYQSERFILLETDAAIAVDILHMMGIKIDVFICWNEGLFEGGGDYAINDRVFLRFLTPILADNYTHISNDHYFGVYAPRIPNLCWDFLNYDGEVLHQRKLRHIIRAYVNEGHRFGEGATMRLFRRHNMPPPFNTSNFPCIGFVNGNIWSAKDIDTYFIAGTKGYYRKLLMRRIDKNDRYHQIPSSLEGNYVVGPNNKRSRYLKIPHWNKVLTKCSNRYSINLETIHPATLEVIRNLKRGSRVGIDAFRADISNESLRLMSEAARASGCEVFLYI